MGTPASDAKPSSAVKYAYMFEKDKSPTIQLDALLRAIAKHIILEVGDKHEKHLTPKKLAAFYKSVGGDYDSLFVDMPHPSISYVWQVTGCQHTLQPTENDFAPPSVPALTFRGFSRWESLEILLGPEEHVPFMQFAVKNWALKHPETGEAFPADLPKDVFPAVADADVDRWHQSCAQKLRTEAAVKNETPQTKPEPVPENQSPKFAYVHVRKPFQEQPTWRRHVDPAHLHRGNSYNQPPGRYAAPKGPDRSPDRGRHDPSPKAQARRRSFSDIPSPTSNEPPIHAFPSAYDDRNAKRPAEQRRRHSHPRHYSSDESSDEAPVPPKSKRRQHPESPPPPSVRRFVPPLAPQPPPATNSPPPSFRPHRPDVRPDDHKKRSVPSPRGSLRNKLSETVSNILPNGLVDRPRNAARHGSYNEPLRPRRSRDHFQPSRLSHRYSDEQSSESLGDESSEDELQRRRRSRDTRDERDRDRDRDRYRDRGRPRDQDRELDDDRDVGSRRDRQYLQRPPIERRTSSHADVDRRRDHPMFDAHNRDRLKDDRKRWDRRSQEERGSSPMTGVNGRRYHPEPAYG
ncbi:hypothetical protein HJFPF1_01742 [Paramyrothecium foliicola]|nr:hypothetical protein HJFPF1_01742 [Paramyrothecium foliicola]